MTSKNQLKSKTESLIKNQRGQSLVEAILIMFVFILIASAAGQQARQNELLINLVHTPWVALSNLIKNGAIRANTEDANFQHPNHYHRHLSLKGEEVQ